MDPNVDEHSVMTYLSQFPKAKLKPGAPVRSKQLNPKKAIAYGPGTCHPPLASPVRPVLRVCVGVCVGAQGSALGDLAPLLPVRHRAPGQHRAAACPLHRADRGCWLRRGAGLHRGPRGSHGGGRAKPGGVMGSVPFPLPPLLRKGLKVAVGATHHAVKASQQHAAGVRKGYDHRGAPTVPLPTGQGGSQQ